MSRKVILKLNPNEKQEVTETLIELAQLIRTKIKFKNITKVIIEGIV